MLPFDADTAIGESISVHHAEPFVRTPTSDELAYMAGVIDSDGYIGIRRSTYGMRVRKDCTQPVYYERVGCKQVQPQAVELLHKYFGGALGRDNPSVPRGKILYNWQVTNVKAMAFLCAVLPYLRIKRAQAHNCLCLRAVMEQSKQARRRTRQVRPIHLSAEMERLYLAQIELNKMGTSGERMMRTNAV